MTDSIHDDPFDRKRASKALLSAVTDLCQRSGQSLESMEMRTMGQIYSLAQVTYKQELPEFWQIWSDWARPNEVQPMGDL